MPRAIGYVRVSTDKQLENTSIEKQKEEIIKYCNNNHITLVRIYDEGAFSAENMKDRKEFKRTYQHLFDPNENIDQLVTYKSDRISRNNMESLWIYKKITDADKHLVCIANKIDTHDKNAKLLFQIMALVSEFERDMIKFNTSNGLEKNASNGNFNGGKVYGYNMINKKLELDPNEAKVIRYIFEKYAIDKWGYRKIAANLNQQLISTKKGNIWTITAVKTILTNKIYIGEIKWKGKHQKGNHTRIIDDKLWYQAQKTLQIKSYIPEKLHPGTYPLSGLLKCPECGSPMVQGNSKKYKYYQCSRNKNSGKVGCSSNLVKKETAEQFVFKHFFQTLNQLNLSSLVFDTISNTLSSEIEPLEDKVKMIKTDVKRFEKKKSDLITWRSDEVLDETTFRNEMKKLQQEENKLNQFLHELEKKIKQRQTPELKSKIMRTFENPETFMSVLSEKDKKKILHEFIESIQVNKGNKPRERTIRDIKFKFDLVHLSPVSE